MNDRSTRAHALLIVDVEQLHVVTGLQVCTLSGRPAPTPAAQIVVLYKSNQAPNTRKHIHTHNTTQT